MGWHLNSSCLGKLTAPRSERAWGLHRLAKKNTPEIRGKVIVFKMGHIRRSESLHEPTEFNLSFFLMSLCQKNKNKIIIQIHQKIFSLSARYPWRGKKEREKNEPQLTSLYHLNTQAWPHLTDTKKINIFLHKSFKSSKCALLGTDNLISKVKQLLILSGKQQTQAF